MSKSAPSSPGRRNGAFGKFRYKGSLPSTPRRKSFNQLRVNAGVLTKSPIQSPAQTEKHVINKWRKYKYSGSLRQLCSISGPTPNLNLLGLQPEIWDEIVSYLPVPSAKAFGLCSRSCRFLAVKQIFRYVRVSPPLIQKIKRELFGLSQYFRDIELKITDIRWARHFFWEIGWYESVTGLDLHFRLPQYVEATLLVAAFRSLSKCNFYERLVRISWRYQYADKKIHGTKSWFEILPEEHQKYLGQPFTKAEATENIKNALSCPPSLRSVVLDVSEGLDPNGIYFKFYSAAPKLKELDIERWLPPPSALRTASTMFPRLQKLRIGLQVGSGLLHMIVDTVSNHFPNLHFLQMDGFGEWWSFALQGEIVFPNSLDGITKLKNLKTLVIPCPAALGPKRPQMVTISAIYRLCPGELDILLTKWVESGMKLEVVTFDGYLVHKDGYEYFELNCRLETKVVIAWDHLAAKQTRNTFRPNAGGDLPPATMHRG